MGFFVRRTGDPEVAADLTAETFASAIVAQRRFDPGRAPAVAWLFSIATRRLADYRRRGWVDQRVRRSLQIERRPVSVDDADLIRVLADDVVTALERPAARPARRRGRARGRRPRLRRSGGRGTNVRAGGATARLARARHAAPTRRGPRMSDYLTELRRDLVDAHGRHRRSRTLPRAARALRRRPQVALAALAAAACAAGLLTGAAALRDRAPAEALRVVAVVPLGGQPIDATLVAGSLWVARYDGDVLRVDPVRREVVRRIRLGRNVSSIAGTARDVWVTTEPAVDESGGRLVRLDPATGDISARVRLGAFAAVLAAGDRSLWALDSQNDTEAPVRIRRIDPADGATLASVATAPPEPTSRSRPAPCGRWGATAPSPGWMHGCAAPFGALPRVGAVPVSSDDQLAVDARGAWMVSPGTTPSCGSRRAASCAGSPSIHARCRPSPARAAPSGRSPSRPARGTGSRGSTPIRAGRQRRSHSGRTGPRRWCVRPAASGSSPVTGTRCSFAPARRDTSGRAPDGARQRFNHEEVGHAHRTARAVADENRADRRHDAAAVGGLALIGAPALAAGPRTAVQCGDVVDAQRPRRQRPHRLPRRRARRRRTGHHRGPGRAHDRRQRLPGGRLRGRPP